MDEISFEFAGFTLWPQRRFLESKGAQVKLGSREFDILVTLVEREGDVVSTEDILRLVWPNENVAEAIVRVRVALLRKALGEPALARKLIATVVGGGYTFLGGAVRKSGIGMRSHETKTRVPASLSRIYGRDLFISQIEKALKRQRLITLAGPGGVGKTTVALEICRRTAEQFEGIFIVDLVTVVDPAMVATEVALTLGIGIHPIDPVRGIVSYLRERRVMIVFDTCEHVLAAVSFLSSRLLSELRHLTMLCTSRSPLEARGEAVFRLEALEIPGNNKILSLDEARQFAAVELFLDRASANSNIFRTEEADVSDLCEIVRRLEGVPLAIEFAASRVHEFGLAGVIARMEHRFQFLNKGSRTASPRHRTLRDTLQWSYGSLTTSERSAFRALGSFAGNFSQSSAAALIPWELRSDEALDSLTSKSLIHRGEAHREPFYRMLDMTREFARDLQEQEMDREDVARRHAADALRLLEMAELDAANPTVSTVKMAIFAQRLGDVRRALEWYFSTSSDPQAAIQFAAKAAVAFIPRGLMDEYLRWVNRALELNALQAHPDRASDARLYASLGTIMHHARGPEMKAAGREAFLASAEASRKAGDAFGEMRAWSAVSAVDLLYGEYDKAVAVAERFAEIPGGKGSITEHRTLAHSTLFAGNFAASENHIRTVLGSGVDANTQKKNLGTNFDRNHVLMCSALAMNLFVTGRADQALAQAEECIENARLADHTLSLAHTLAVAGVPITYLTRGYAAVKDNLELLLHLTTTHSFLTWLEWGRAFNDAIAPRQEGEGDFPGNRIERLARLPLWGVLSEHVIVMCNDFVDDRLLGRALSSSPGWCLSEVLRIRGERSLLGGSIPAQAMVHFQAGLDHARHTGAKAWELRVATSIADLKVRTGNRAEAFQVLEPVVSSFTEGFGTPDYLKARALLEM